MREGKRKINNYSFSKKKKKTDFNTSKSNYAFKN